jgi:hypothetical protein
MSMAITALDRSGMAGISPIFHAKRFDGHRQEQQCPHHRVGLGRGD